MNPIVKLKPDTERHITDILQRSIPYEVTIANCTFIINNPQAYPPGKLTALFVEYLLEKQLLQDKTVIDAGAACFPLGIIAAKNGAKWVIGTDISEPAVQCANENIRRNQVEDKARMIKCDGLSTLLPEYAHQVDILLCGAPWESLSSKDYQSIPDDRKNLSRSFYDVNDALIKDVLTKGPSLLAPEGKMFITSSTRTLPRIKKLCAQYQMEYQIVKEKDIHQDGNIHFILEIAYKHPFGLPDVNPE